MIMECASCGKPVEVSDDMVGYIYCVECLGEVPDFCSECGKPIESDEDKDAYEHFEMCLDCILENSDWICSDCGEHFTNEEHEEGSGLCPSCRFSAETEFYNEHCYE